MKRATTIEGDRGRARLCTVASGRLPALLALLAIVIVAAILRLFNLADNPGWYSDEGTHLEIARHLLQGRVQYFAVGQSVLLFGRLPLFEGVVTGAAALGGLHMLTLRTVTALLGVLAVPLLYTVTLRLAESHGLALLAALLLAIFPQAVIYSRLGFSYNLLAPLVLITLAGLDASLRAEGQAAGRWRILTALAGGLGLISDVMMMTLVPIIIGAWAIHGWRGALSGAAWMLLPPAVYVAVLLLTIPQAFFTDVVFTLGRISMPLANQFSNLFDNLRMVFASGDVWLTGGLIGLLALRQVRTRRLTQVTFILPLLLMGRTVALYSLSAYYLIPLLPLAALGMAVLLWEGRALLLNRANGVIAALLDRVMPGRALVRRAAGGALLLLLMPALVGSLDGLRGLTTGFVTAIDPFLLEGPAVGEAAAFVNARVQTDDVVIASPAVGWLLNGQVADFQMVAAAEGLTTPHLPPDLPADRWIFTPRYDEARFLVVDPLWRCWGAVHVPGVSEVLDVLVNQSPAWEAGTISIYENPFR